MAAGNTHKETAGTLRAGSRSGSGRNGHLALQTKGCVSVNPEIFLGLTCPCAGVAFA